MGKTSIDAYIPPGGKYKINLIIIVSDTDTTSFGQRNRDKDVFPVDEGRAGILKCLFYESFTPCIVIPFISPSLPSAFCPALYHPPPNKTKFQRKKDKNSNLLTAAAV